MISAQRIRSTMAIFWLGFFMAISFMEAPLKFTAPNLSLAEGVQIGRIIFAALNRCEWAFLIIIITTCFFKRSSVTSVRLIAAVGFILLLETAWLLPALNVGAMAVIHHQPVARHWLHWVYIIFDVLKVPALLFIGLENKNVESEPL